MGVSTGRTGPVITDFLGSILAGELKSLATARPKAWVARVLRSGNEARVIEAFVARVTGLAETELREGAAELVVKQLRVTLSREAMTDELLLSQRLAPPGIINALESLAGGLNEELVARQLEGVYRRYAERTVEEIAGIRTNATEWLKKSDRALWRELRGLEERVSAVERVTCAQEKRFAELGELVVHAAERGPRLPDRPSHSCPEHYIPRSVSEDPSDMGTPAMWLFGDQGAGQDVIDVLREERHVVLLADAAQGKSWEMERVAAQLPTTDYPFLLHTRDYVPGNGLWRYLPQGADAVPHEHLVLLLDGLDEVPPTELPVAKREIQSLVSQFPRVRVLVSCRAKVYREDDGGTGATLAGFNVRFL